MKRTAKATGIAIGLLSLPTVASACIVCRFAEAEHMLPHSKIWCHASAIWFFAVMLLTGAENKSGRFFKAVFFVLLTYYLGFRVVGPCAFMLLGCITFCITVKNSRQKIRQKLSKGSRIGFTLVSIAAFFAVPAGCAISMNSGRSDADFILYGNAYGRAPYYRGVVLQRLISNPAENEDQLRQILVQTKDEDMAEKITVALTTLEEERTTTDTQTDLHEEQGESDTERKKL
jgi:hypothetical protein